MSNTSCQEKNASKARKMSGWDKAILEAQTRIKELQFSISVFRRRKRAGQLWPGQSNLRRYSGLS
jgi:hypothetical protein